MSQVESEKDNFFPLSILHQAVRVSMEAGISYEDTLALLMDRVFTEEELKQFRRQVIEKDGRKALPLVRATFRTRPIEQIEIDKVVAVLAEKDDPLMNEGLRQLVDNPNFQQLAHSEGVTSLQLNLAQRAIQNIPVDEAAAREISELIKRKRESDGVGESTFSWPRVVAASDTFNDRELVAVGITSAPPVHSGTRATNTVGETMFSHFQDPDIDLDRRPQRKLVRNIGGRPILPSHVSGWNLRRSLLDPPDPRPDEL